MELVTGFAGTPHVTPQQIAEFQQAIAGGDDYVLNTGSQLTATLLSNNKIRISDGGICMQGRHAVIPKNQNEEVTIQNGTQGEKRLDLIVERYAKDSITGIETVRPYTLKGTATTGTPVTPRPTKGDIRAGDILHEMPLYAVELNGVNIVKVTSLYKTLTDIFNLQDKINTLNSNLSFELGSNINGSYKKYTNGLLEQWGNKYVGDYRNANIIAGSIIFPISFIDVNYVINISKNGMGNQSDTVGASVCVEDKGIEGFTAYLQRESGGFKNGYGSTCGWCANGRWK